MITEDYCSYEVAKLLKENGFDGEIHTTFDKEGYTQPSITHQMAMKWLREVYHIEINITFGFPFIDGEQQYKYFWSIVRVCDNHLEYPMDDQNSAFYNEEMADSYEEAVEAALKYSLKELLL